MLFRLTAVVALVAAAAVSACASRPEAPVELALESPKLATASGLSAAELSALSGEVLQKVFRVQVKGAGARMAGTYDVSGGQVRFTPAFPFDKGREYVLEVVLDQIPGHRRSGTIARTVSLAPEVRGIATRVISIDPTARTWPANLLRIYIHFSAPMSRESGVGRIVLRGDDGVEVTEAFLPLEADFWSPDHLRYTVFLDPGRVKRGVLPNRQRGRALVAGKSYALEVDAQWRDATGRPLAAAFRREFRAGPAIERPMRVEDWRLSPASAGGRTPLVVTFPWPIDRGLADRSLSVSSAEGRPIAGTGVLADGDLAWSFTPALEWQAGDYRLAALPLLEDPSGNQIGRAFEVDMKQESPPVDARRSVAFRIPAAAASPRASDRK